MKTWTILAAPATCLCLAQDTPKDSTGWVPMFDGPWEPDRPVEDGQLPGGGVGRREPPLSGADLCFYNRLKRWSPHKRRVAANDSCGGKLQAALAKFPPVVLQTRSAADWCSLGRGISVVGT